MYQAQTIIEKLIARDEFVTRHFFFEKCRPLFVSIINRVFSFYVDYDEFVNELYLHIMENDAARLRQFEGKSSIYQWLKVVAIRFFIAKRKLMIEEQSKESFLQLADGLKKEDTEERIDANMDIQTLLSKMHNRRQAYVIQKLVLEERKPQEIATALGVNVTNLYNIKKRALESLARLALNEIAEYENRI